MVRQTYISNKQRQQNQEAAEGGNSSSTMKPCLSIREMRKNEQIIRMIEKAEKAKVKSLARKQRQKQSITGSSSAANTKLSVKKHGCNAYIVTRNLKTGLFSKGKKAKESKFFVYRSPAIKLTFSDNFAQQAPTQNNDFRYIQERQKAIEQKQLPPTQQTMPMSCAIDQNIPIPSALQQSRGKVNNITIAPAAAQPGQAIQQQDASLSVTDHFYGGSSAGAVDYSLYEQCAEESECACAECVEADWYQYEMAMIEMMKSGYVQPEYTPQHMEAMSQQGVRSLLKQQQQQFQENSRSKLNSSMHEKAFPVAHQFKLLPTKLNQQSADMTIKKHSVADELSSGEASSSEQTALSAGLSFSSAASQVGSPADKDAGFFARSISSISDRQKNEVQMQAADASALAEQRDILAITKQMMLGKTWHQAREGLSQE